MTFRSAAMAGLPMTLFALTGCAATGTPAGDRLPLIAGVEPEGPLRRKDIDVDAVPPHDLPFPIDCTVLRYAEGKEQEFCYAKGHWMTLHSGTAWSSPATVASSAASFSGTTPKAVSSRPSSARNTIQ